MSHQDFTTVVLRRQPTKKESGEPILKHGAGKNHKTNDEASLARKIENEQVKLPTATDEIKKGMIKGRADKKLNQEQLAKLCSLPKQTIRDYENGTGVVKLSELQAINKVLGTTLHKPKAIKIDNN
jgi:ribosome-binding protein aMBF1 (putative translation factor)